MASHGGSIALASGNGLRLDGSLIARAGGAGAAGGSLSVALEAPLYQDALATRRVLWPRELVLRQTHAPLRLAGGRHARIDRPGLNYGEGSLGMDRVAAGGFGSLALLSQGMISFDGNLSLAMAQSLSLYSASMGLSENAPRDARTTWPRRICGWRARWCAARTGTLRRWCASVCPRARPTRRCACRAR